MDTKRLQTLAGILREGYMGTSYASSEDMAVDMIKKGITREGDSWHPDDPAGVDLDDMEDEDPEDFDDVSEDDSEAYSESGNTDAMGGIDEAGNIKGIKIEIPGNSYASDFGRAAAREVIESFGTPGFREFLQGFTEEIAKLTNRR